MAYRWSDPSMLEILEQFTPVSMASKLCKEKCEECVQEATDDANEDKDDDFVEVENSMELVENFMQLGLAESSMEILVIAGERHFACSGLLLYAYSDFFKERRGMCQVDLRKTPITAQLFQEIYEWMLEPDKRPALENITEIYLAACYLQIKDLTEHCFLILCSDNFCELDAFDVLILCRNIAELGDVSLALIRRISKCALVIMSSPHFLRLSELQVSALAESNELAVNSECEVAFAVLRWLQQNWPERRESMVKVLSNVRYEYFPPLMLTKLIDANCSDFGPLADIMMSFISAPSMKNLIENGMFYATLVLTTAGNIQQIERTLKNFRSKDAKSTLVPRRWMRHERCMYHRPISATCPNMRPVTFDQYNEYIELLQKPDFDFENEFELAAVDGAEAKQN
ncbi:CG8260 [Drosophila busckii]|uniref:CG8260 n=1 Tax=Drosophila busckii TaxID=30019 RepID=A0A0M5J0U4_DROBS|nr:uncharacterized protein LOC108605993 [Drosophila busckii]ALC48394.1 CG8260 [Drosophila busckii]